MWVYGWCRPAASTCCHAPRLVRKAMDCGDKAYVRRSGVGRATQSARAGGARASTMPIFNRPREHDAATLAAKAAPTMPPPATRMS